MAAHEGRPRTSLLSAVQGGAVVGLSTPTGGAVGVGGIGSCWGKWAAFVDRGHAGVVSAAMFGARGCCPGVYAIW